VGVKYKARKMSKGQAVWRKMREMFANLAQKREKKLLQQSHANPIVRIHFRDSFRYYEKGRWVTVSGELMSRRSDVKRVIYRQCALKWNDTGPALTTAERENVFQKVGEHLDRSGIQWKFDGEFPTRR